MTLFPELRYRGLLSDVPTLPGLLGQPLGPQASQPPPQAPQPPPAPAPQPQGDGGGIKQLLGSIFGGQDDPRLSPDQNAAAKHQALIQAGLAILASPDSGVRAIAQGGLYGQQAGQQNREVIYGRTQQERVANALRDPAVMANLPAEIRAIAPYMNPGDLLKIITDTAKGRFLNTGFNGNIYDTVTQKFVQPDGSTKPEDWVQGNRPALNPATNKYENYAYLKTDPTKIRYLGEAQGPQQRLTTDASGHRVPDVPGVAVPLPKGGSDSTGFGSSGITGAARLVSAAPTMRLVHDDMKGYEQQIHDGKISMSGFDQFHSLLAGNFDKKGLVDQAIFSAANETLAKTNPQLANYLQNEYMWALEESSISPRPSDFRTTLDKFVSAMKAGSTPQMIENLWKLRETRLLGYELAAEADAAKLRKIAGTEGDKPKDKPVNPFMAP